MSDWTDEENKQAAEGDEQNAGVNEKTGINELKMFLTKHKLRCLFPIMVETGFDDLSFIREMNQVYLSLSTPDISLYISPSISFS